MLGKIMAMYEHKVFTQGIVWKVNSFGEMGVELGKELARNIYDQISTSDIELTQDSSTCGLIDYYTKHRTSWMSLIDNQGKYDLPSSFWLLLFTQ